MRRARAGPALALLVAAPPARVADAWRAAGALPVQNEFVHYAGKFCFDYVPVTPEQDGPGAQVPAAGRLEALVNGEVVEIGDPLLQNVEQGRLFLMIFDDEDKHWGQAWARWEELGCTERRNYSSSTYQLSGDLKQDPHKYQMDVEVHQGIRPRWWYFVFVNCGAKVLQPISYQLHAQNPTHTPVLGIPQSEFSMDADGSLGLQAFFCALFSVATVFSCGYAGAPWDQTSARSEASRPRPWLRLLQASLGLSAAGCGLYTMHHFVYSFNGWGLKSADILGAMAVCGAKLMLNLLQLLIAGGWALLNSEDEQPTRIRSVIAGAVFGIFLVSICCEFHQQYGRDTSSAIYLYESWPGTIILLLNVALLMLSASLMRETYQKERVSEARSFYRSVSFAIGVYYVSLPVVCLLATLLSPWVRLKYVQRVELCVRFGVSIMLLRWLRPSHLDSIINRRIEVGPELELSSDSEEDVSDGELVDEPKQGPL